MSGLKAFRETYLAEKVMPGIIVYSGHECYRLDDQTMVIPWNLL